ncbi:MAG: serine hydrolase [bacterium]|nr:MAG: serine hydrolase [bacterium]
MVVYPRLKSGIRLKLYISLTMLLFILLTCRENTSLLDIQSPPIITIPEQTEDGWETGSLEEVGIRTAPILDMLSYLKNQPEHHVHSILLIKEAKLVFETYYKGHAYQYYNPNFQGEDIIFDRETPQCTHSVTKSITSICVGICRDLGYLQNIEEKVFALFPEYSGLSSPEKDQITIRHLLTMSSGLEWNEQDVDMRDPSNDLIHLAQSHDPLGYILGKPLVDPPGTHFNYNGGNTNLLSEIIRKYSGMKLDLLSETYLFTPLGIIDFQWQYFYNGLVYASGDVYLRPRDMAKLGYLFLKKGIWKGERILSEEWIMESTQTHMTVFMGGYGYQWWTSTFKIRSSDHVVYYVPNYSAIGWGGQSIKIFPSLDMVAVFTGSNYVSRSSNNDLVREYILPAVLF